MSHESAPATLLLATNCAACGRPLVDAVSAEMGIGPICRDRLGLENCADDELRAQANKIVWRIAREHDKLRIADHAARLHLLGFTALAKRIIQRIAGRPSVNIEREDDLIIVKTRFDEEAVALMRRVRGRRWDSERKVNTFPASSASELLDALRQAFPGETAVGPKGKFVL